MHYKINFPEPEKHFIEFELTIDHIQSEQIEIQLPAWRPGRYELQNFTGNIQYLKAYDTHKKQALKTKKINKNRWLVHTPDQNKIKICYNYYANIMDGGNSLLDTNQVYINFINCCFYAAGRIHEAYELDINIPETYKIATSLKQLSHTQFYADNFYQLADTPLVASPNMQHLAINVNNTDFHLWFQGNCKIPEYAIKNNFPEFIKYQTSIFGEFPEKAYHFIYQVLPYRMFHGVEHANSTMIILGHEEKFQNTRFNKIFWGISAHELFHTWNIKHLRPKALLPYDFTQENYFETCYIAEGVTTYYGDYSLLKSGVWTPEEFFEEINDNLKKHLHNAEGNQQSLAESSTDLWVDGYKKGIPGKKVSVYDKGALAALILDIEILKATGNAYSLNDVMKKMWKKFGKNQTGYTSADYKMIIEEITNTSFNRYFDEIIFGNQPILSWLKHAFDYVGCRLAFNENQNQNEYLFGYKITMNHNGKYQVTNIAKYSPAYNAGLVIEDCISKVNGIPAESNSDTILNSALPLVLTVIRNENEVNINLKPAQQYFFQNPAIKKQGKASEAAMNNFKKWTGWKFQL